MLASDSGDTDLSGFMGANSVVVGAPGIDGGNAASQGAAYIFLDLNVNYLPMIRR